MDCEEPIVSLKRRADKEPGDSLFVTKKKSRVAVKKETVSLFTKPTTQILSVISDDSGDSEHQVTTTNTLCDVDAEYVSNSDELERKRENVLVASLLACELYLEPDNVMLHVLYWLAGYVNFKKPQQFWFNDHIRGLIKYPPQLSLSSSRGVPHIHDSLPKYTLLIRFAGSDLHKLMSEFFVINDKPKILECLRYMTQPENHCFRNPNTYGLRGEIEIDEFAYDTVMSYFYEPSFYILTSYLIYVNYMCSSLCKGRCDDDYRPQLRTIRAPLVDYEVERIGALNKKNSNYAVKLADFQHDLARMHKILRLKNLKKLRDELETMWTEKATFACDQIEERYKHIYSQLYDDSID